MARDDWLGQIRAGQAGGKMPPHDDFSSYGFGGCMPVPEDIEVDEPMPVVDHARQLLGDVDELCSFAPNVEPPCASSTYYLQLITDYYNQRKLKWPSTTQAVMWAITEIGEVCEVLLARNAGWVRNNPDDHRARFTAHEEWSRKLSEELGDVIMMCVVAGIANGSNVLAHLEDKIERKLNEQHRTDK